VSFGQVGPDVKCAAVMLFREPQLSKIAIGTSQIAVRLGGIRKRGRCFVNIATRQALARAMSSSRRKCVSYASLTISCQRLWWSSAASRPVWENHEVAQVARSHHNGRRAVVPSSFQEVIP